jgi:menaquinone-dependent protoporphyrinogen oxidase
MPSQRILIVYGSSYGHTARIASRIRHLLTADGYLVTLRRGDELPDGFEVHAYDGVIVGASMIVGGYQKYIARFVEGHAAALNGMPSAFFAVSGSAGSTNAVERAEAQRRMTAFCTAEGWHPTLTASVAGAISYTKYAWPLRWYMKRISKKEGVSTDTTRDHVYTDWNQVERFAHEFAMQLANAERRHAPRDVSAATLRSLTGAA